MTVTATYPRPVRRWTLCSAILAPVTLTCAWIVSGALQPSDYSAVHQSISALAAYSASERWIMTTGIYLVGVCQLVTAAGLTQLRPAARAFLALGGITGLGVAYFPQPDNGSTDMSPHIVFATLSVVSLAVWPAIIGSRGLFRRTILTARTIAIVTGVFIAMLAWVYVAGHGAGGLGVAERVDTTVANIWPLVVIVALARAETEAGHERARAARQTWAASVRRRPTVGGQNGAASSTTAAEATSVTG